MQPTGQPPWWKRFGRFLLGWEWRSRIARALGLIGVMHGIDHFTHAFSGGLLGEGPRFWFSTVAIWAIVELIAFPRIVRHGLAPPVLPTADLESRAGGDIPDLTLEEFIARVDFGSVRRVMVIANTGEITVRSLYGALERAMSKIRGPLPVHVLLQSPTMTDHRRAEGIARTKASSRDFLSHQRRADLFRVETRHYSTICPLRCILFDHEDGTASGFLSFYDWHQRGPLEEISQRDAASTHAIPRFNVSRDDPLLRTYLSWFLHFWGVHPVHTLLFDFDDTLFSTTVAQVEAWMAAIRKVDAARLLPRDALNPTLRPVLNDDHALKDALTAMFLDGQQEEVLFPKIWPTGLTPKLMEDIRAIRLPIREALTVRHATPIPNIIDDVKQLSAEYQIAIVSATTEQTIAEVIRNYGLGASYILGRSAPGQDWQGVEQKSQNFIRISNMLGIPLERMVFVGDARADFLSARQVGLKFIENRYNAQQFGRSSVLGVEAQEVRWFLNRDTAPGSLVELVRSINAEARAN